MKRIRYLDYNSIFSLITCAIKLDIFGKSCDKNWPRIYNKSKYLKVSNDRQESHISVCHMLFFTSLLIERMSRSINHWINQSRHIFKTLSTWECAYHRQTINSMWWLRCARLFCEFKRKTRFTHKLQKRRNINRTATITKTAKKIVGCHRKHRTLTPSCSISHSRPTENIHEKRSVTWSLTTLSMRDRVSNVPAY